MITSTMYLLLKNSKLYINIVNYDYKILGFYEILVELILKFYLLI